MGLVRWFTKNWANTLEPTHPDLTPLALPVSVDSARERVRRAAAWLRGWNVVDQSGDRIQLTRRTRLFRFTDDITITFVPTETATLIHAESRSRIGKGDLGQNRRNILELFAAVRANS